MIVYTQQKNKLFTFFKHEKNIYTGNYALYIIWHKFKFLATFDVVQGRTSPLQKG